jgi:hypothetical protein
MLCRLPSRPFIKHPLLHRVMSNFCFPLRHVTSNPIISSSIVSRRNNHISHRLRHVAPNSNMSLRRCYSSSFRRAQNVATPSSPHHAPNSYLLFTTSHPNFAFLVYCVSCSILRCLFVASHPTNLFRHVTQKKKPPSSLRHVAPELTSSIHPKPSCLLLHVLSTILYILVTPNLTSYLWQLTFPPSYGVSSSSCRARTLSPLGPFLHVFTASRETLVSSSSSPRRTNLASRLHRLGPTFHLHRVALRLLYSFFRPRFASSSSYHVQTPFGFVLQRPYLARLFPITSHPNFRLAFAAS